MQAQIDLEFHPDTVHPDDSVRTFVAPWPAIKWAYTGATGSAGWPVYSFTGPPADIQAFLLKFAQGDPEIAALYAIDVVSVP